MVATKHIRSSPPTPPAGEKNPAGTSDADAIERLLQHAADCGLRAPELTLVLGERAASLAEAAGSDALWVRAEGLVVSARVRLGFRAGSVARGVAALRAAEDLSETRLVARLRTDLTVCARSVGAPLTGLAALRPVLAAEGLTGAGKAAALSQMVGCLSQFGRKPELDRALAEADRLCGADESLDGDGRLLARALLRVGMSAHRRRHADILGAADAARTGLGLLEQLDDPGCDGGVVRVRLILHLVCSLLDRGDSENALEIAQPFLDAPARAAAIAPVSWLRMAVATRILLPSGGVEAAAVMLRDAVYSTERHGLHALTSRLWMELSTVEQRQGRASAAMECLHQARAAEHVYARSRRQAIGLLSGEFGNGGHAAVNLDDVLAAAPHAELGPVDETAPQADGHTRGRDVRLTSIHADAGAGGASGVPGAQSDGDGTGARRVVERTSAVAVERSADAPRSASNMEQVTASGGGRRRKQADVDAAVPDLPLAPPPADEPAPRFSLVFEPKASTAEAGSAGTRRRAVDDPGGPGPARGDDRRGDRSADAGVETRVLRGLSDGPTAQQARGSTVDAAAEQQGGGRPANIAADRPARGEAAQARTEPEVGADGAKRTTRHDSEHGSVAARSVLDRLGIAAGPGAGGRRRADDAEQGQRGWAGSESDRTLDPARADTPERTSPTAEPRVRAAGGEPETGSVGGNGARNASAASGSAEKATRVPSDPGADITGGSAAGAAAAAGAKTRLSKALEPRGSRTTEDGSASSLASADTGAALDAAKADSTIAAPSEALRAGAEPAGGQASDTGRHGAAANGVAAAKRVDHDAVNGEALHSRHGAESSSAGVNDQSAGAGEPGSGTGPSRAEGSSGEGSGGADGSGEGSGGGGGKGGGASGGEPGGGEGGSGGGSGIAGSRRSGSGEGSGGTGDGSGGTGEGTSAGGGGARDGSSGTSAGGGTGEGSGGTGDGSGGTGEGGGTSAGGGGSSSDGVTVNENWLPKLRLPPSLEPFEDFTDEALASASETHFTSAPNIEGDGLEPFRADHAGKSFVDEELPEDAGLADLLARALAEHRAGTSSAAALVKRLGNGSEVKRPVNGHGRNGEAPGKGRHGTDG